MAERVFIVSNRDADLGLIKETLGSKGFNIDTADQFSDIESMILSGSYAAILADNDFAGDRVAGWINLLQEKKSRSCLILYGEKNSPGNIAELLRKGAYGFIPRDLLADRVYDILLDGLENRKAFIEILAMMDDMKEINEKLEKEKTALRKRNQELDFINRLSYEVSFDLNWDRILPRMIDAGFLNIIDSETIYILYRLGSRWNFACYLPGGQSDEKAAEKLKKEAAAEFFSLSRERIPMREISVSFHSFEGKRSLSNPIFLSDKLVLPLSPGGRTLGVMVILPKNREAYENGNHEILSTISNILAMSLDNAEKYQKLKKLTIRDGLTGVYNRMGFKEFMESEFLKARRYRKPLSLIMIDVDKFKTINDSFGHLAGDYVLSELANCLKKTLRQTDILARYGGDEFAIILPETEMQMAEMLMRRALSSIRDHNFEWKSEKIKVEVSCGVASAGELGHEDGTGDLIAMADSRLYHSKRSYESCSTIGIEGEPFWAAV
ncbi:MAG: diguanylate cyclase [Desulfobacterales bacterium]|nr:diguanylate cyclase [Desulfobacterales bacterium]